MITYTAEKISFAYNGGRNIFTDVDLAVSKGEVFTILGSNGTGKSTLLNCIAGQLKPLSGKVQIGGKAIESMSTNEFALHVAYVGQLHYPMFAYSVREVVVMGRLAYLGISGSPKHSDYKIAENMMELMGVSHLADKSYLEISGGERQLVMFAQALTQTPDFLVLDEPTSHLDFGNQIRCLEIVQKVAGEGYGVILSSHFPDHSFMFNHRVGILHEGRFIAIGNAKDVITEENMSAIYNIPVSVDYNASLGRLTCLPKGGKL